MSIVRIPTGLQNDLAQKIIDRIDAGGAAATIEVRTGAMPASANDAASGTLLGTLTLSFPCAPAPVAGVITFSTITEDSVADNEGAIGYARVKASDATTATDVDCGTEGSGATLEFNTLNVIAGGPIRVTSFTLTVPAG